MAKKTDSGDGKTNKRTIFDFVSVLGWVIGLGLMVFGIVFIAKPKATGDAALDDKANVSYAETGPFNFGKMAGFIDPPSIAITFGGTIAALMIAFPASAFAKVPKHLKIILFPVKYDTQDYIDQIVMFAKEARMRGLLSLEDKLQTAHDPFLRSSLMLVVDSVEPEKVHNLLETELEHMDERHAQARAFYDKGAGFAPGFGMIGTLIGLVNMLGDMSDVSSLSKNMATALLTTLYGSMLGNLFFAPISNKLRIRHEEEYLCKVLICEGVEAIQAGENPRFIEEKLQMLVLQAEKGRRRSKKTAAASETK